mgnify:CR=1 FL=1
MKEKALNKMADYCSKAERCTDDVRRKLIKYELSEEQRNDIIKYLIKERFIDDKRYAILYARDKARFNNWGPQKIRFQLLNKHISSEIIDEALSQTDIDEQIEKLQTLLTNKAQQIKHDDKWKLRNQLIRFGLSKGFDYNTVLKAPPKDVDKTEE